MNHVNFTMSVTLSVIFVLTSCYFILQAYSQINPDAIVSYQIKEKHDGVSEMYFTEQWTLTSDPTDSIWSLGLLRAKEDEVGNLYLADVGNNRVMRLNPNNREIVWAIGHAGHEPGSFLGLGEIDTFGEKVFIREGWNERVQVFGNDGSYQFMLDLTEYHISDFAAGSENLLYIADSHAADLISVFDSYGELVDSFGKRPVGNTNDTESHSQNHLVVFDVDASGNTYLIVYTNSNPDPKFRKYSASRHLEYEIGLDLSLFKGGIRKLIVGKDNNVYIISNDFTTVYSYSSNLTLRSKINLGLFAKNGYVFLYDIDASGNLLITRFSDYGDISVSKLVREVE